MRKVFCDGYGHGVSDVCDDEDSVLTIVGDVDDDELDVVRVVDKTENKVWVGQPRLNSSC